MHSIQFCLFSNDVWYIFCIIFLLILFILLGQCYWFLRHDSDSICLFKCLTYLYNIVYFQRLEKLLMSTFFVNHINQLELRLFQSNPMQICYKIYEWKLIVPVAIHILYVAGEKKQMRQNKWIKFKGMNINKTI